MTDSLVHSPAQPAGSASSGQPSGVGETSSVVAVLAEARRLISEVGWTQDAMARAAGLLIDPMAPNADCFCSVGAIKRASGDTSDSAIGHHGAWEALSRTTNSESVMEWNDTPGRTKEEVLAAFDRAIAKASNGEGR